MSDKVQEVARHEARTSWSVRDMTYCALMAVIIAVCSWITIPIGAVPFTMQTLGHILCAGAAGRHEGHGSDSGLRADRSAGRAGICRVCVGRGRAGEHDGRIYTRVHCNRADSTGWSQARTGGSWMAKALGMALGLIGCYAFGTAWFMAAVCQDHRADRTGHGAGAGA